MSIRAKFYCVEVAKTASGIGSGTTGEQVKLAAVYGGNDPNDPNKAWSKWTPSGQLTLHITNPDAVGQFEPGKTYFLDITPADEPAAP